MKNAILVMSFFLSLLLPGIVFTGSAGTQDVVYSQTFTSGITYSPGSPQYDNWVSFRAQLDTGTHTFTRATISGSNDPVGVSCTDPVSPRWRTPLETQPRVHGRAIAGHGMLVSDAVQRVSRAWSNSTRPAQIAVAIARGISSVRK